MHLKNNRYLHQFTRNCLESIYWKHPKSSHYLSKIYAKAEPAMRQLVSNPIQILFMTRHRDVFKWIVKNTSTCSYPLAFVSLSFWAILCLLVHLHFFFHLIYAVFDSIHRKTLKFDDYSGQLCRRAVKS